MIFGWKAGAILFFLHLLAWVYALIVYILLPKWKIRRSSSGLVVGGVIFTVFGYGFMIGWNTSITGIVSVLAILSCFAVTGIPMIIGYKFKNEYDDNRDNERARIIAKKALDEAFEKVNSKND